MIRFPWSARPRLLSPAECPRRRPPDLRFQRPECREKLKELVRVAVIGGAFVAICPRVPPAAIAAPPPEGLVTGEGG
jgi:hypothetical protein